MKINKVCASVVFLFGSFYLHAADQSKQVALSAHHIAPHVGVQALFHGQSNPAARVPMLWHRMDLQDGMNEMLQAQNKINTQDIETLMDRVLKLTKRTENASAAEKKRAVLDLAMASMHKDIEVLKQHLGMLTESMVKTAQEGSNPFATLNDTSDQPSSRDLILLCESLETSNVELKKELKQQKIEFLALRRIVLKVFKHNPTLKQYSDDDSGSEQGSPTRCPSPDSMHCSPLATPRSDSDMFDLQCSEADTDLPYDASGAFPVAVQLASISSCDHSSGHMRKRSSSDSLILKKAFDFDDLWEPTNETSNNGGTVPVQLKQHSSSDSDENDYFSSCSDSSTGSDSESDSSDSEVEIALPVTIRKMSSRKKKSFHRKPEQSKQEPIN